MDTLRGHTRVPQLFEPTLSGQWETFSHQCKSHTFCRLKDLKTAGAQVGSPHVLPWERLGDKCQLRLTLVHKGRGSRGMQSG